jgi:hypothetical protein
MEQKYSRRLVPDWAGKGQRPFIFVAQDDKKRVGGAAHRDIFRCAAPPTNLSEINLPILRASGPF